MRFCHFVFFHDLFDPLCRFFAVLLFLGSLFGIHFRGRTFVFPVFLWHVAVLVAFCLCFCFIVCLFAPGRALENSLDVRSSLFLRVAFWNPFSGANFYFSCLLVACCFLVVFCLCFFFIVCLFAPEHVLEKFS